MDKRRNYRSALWNLFSPVDEKKRLAKCSVCAKILSYNTSISNLKKHLTRHGYTIKSEDAIKCEQKEENVCTIWEYFTRKSEDAVKCNICIEVVDYASEQSLFDHLKAKHADIQIIDADTEDEQDIPTVKSRPNNDSLTSNFTKDSSTADVSKCNICSEPIQNDNYKMVEHLKEAHKLGPLADDLTDAESDDGKLEFNGRNIRRSVVWKFFTRRDKEQRVARCLFCNRDFSYYSSVGNLKKHLDRRHKLNLKSEEYVKVSPDNSPKLSAIWMYFAKSENDSVKCNICGDNVECDDDESLHEHIKQKHIDVQVIDGKTDVEDNTDSENKSKNKLTKCWSHFDVTSAADKMAECKLCKMTISYEEEINIVQHLKEKHFIETSNSNNDGWIKSKISDTGEIFRLGDDDNAEEENAIFLEEYTSPVRNKKRMRKSKTFQKRKRSSFKMRSDSDSEDNLNIYDNVKGASTPDESLRYFSQYLVSLLRELPKDVSRKLQLDFIMQINEARAQSKRTVGNCDSSD